MNLSSDRLTMFFYCLKNIAFDLNDGITGIEFYNKFCFASKRNQNNFLEAGYNRKARLIYFLVPNPPSWIVRGSGDDVRFHIRSDTSCLASSEPLEDDCILSNTSTEAMLKEACISIQMGSAKKRRLGKTDEIASLINDPFVESLVLSPRRKGGFQWLLIKPFQHSQEAEAVNTNASRQNR